MEIYIARQPIFGRDGALFGYEFLFRNGSDNKYDPGMDGNSATRSLLSNLITEFGLDSLTGGLPAFVNFTRELLDGGCPYLFSPSDFVIEILEDVPCDGPLLGQLRKLKEAGYLLAVDDYTGDPALDGMVRFADILKVDFRLTSPPEQAAIALRHRAGKRLLAEKVETKEELEWARENGYSLFQGYYFSRPIVLAKRTAELASATYARLWQETRKPEPDFDALTRIIRADVTLSYKLLARANSPYYYRGNRIGSVKSAMIHMGAGDLRRWALSLLMRDLAGENGDEPAKRSLVRAVFSESLAVAIGRGELREDAYNAGLFSTIDLILGGGMEDLLQNLNISDAARDALLSGAGPLGDILRYVKNYEIGNWQALPAFLRRYSLEGGDTSAFYLRAVEQAEGVFGCERREAAQTPGRAPGGAV